MPLPPLPITPLLPAIEAALRERSCAVVIAPPGSGKTTRVPPALLDAGLAGKGKLLVLQPRRVAARLAARRMAWERGGRVGEEIGYQVRFERRSGPRTRIELLTEGLLTRRLQRDPFLEGTGCVILDEFHERSLHADLALALLQEARQAGREDLLLVVMSATLDPGPVAAFLGGKGQPAPVLRAEGRRFPVQLSYLERPDDLSLPGRCARALRRVLDEQPEGHVLVFLPGVAEIERTARALGSLPQVDVLPLHGRLPAAQQDRALAPSSRRKIVLATNLAQTSVTLAGVRAVVDSGLARQPRLDPVLGLERLELTRIARDAADQRTGRAGRTGPGLGLRLWTPQEQALLDPATEPEIARSELASTALQLHAWGSDPKRFGWFQAPPAAALAQAEELLRLLGALDGRGRITSLGRQLAALPLHPRLGRVLVAAHQAGQLRQGALAAALTSERDPFPQGLDDPGEDDLQARMAAMAHWDASGRPPAEASRGALHQVRRARDQLLREARAALGPEPAAQKTPLAQLLLAGFPDRVAQRRQPGSRRYRMTGGRGLVLDESSSAPLPELLLAVNLRAARRGQRAEHRVTAAATVQRDWLQLDQRSELAFDPQREAVRASRLVLYRDLELERAHDSGTQDPERVAALLEQAARARPERALRLDPASQALLHRLRFLAHHLPELDWPPLQDLRQWLPELCTGRRSFAALRDLDWRRELLGRLDSAQRAALAREAPERLQLPGGAWTKLRYPDTGGPMARAWQGEPPVLAARIQQLFGLHETPRLARGRVPLLVHLLAPNQRPAQITSDLASFWRSTYHQVRKDLRGRYPKHAWPTDPLGERGGSSS